MTFVGKILVVVHLVLSLCLLGFAGAVVTAHTNWRTVSEERQKQVDQLNTQLATNDAEFERYKNEQSQLLKNAQTRAEGAEASNDRLKEEVAQQQQQIDTLKTELVTQRDLAVIAGDEARLRREESLKQRLANENLHKQIDDLIGQIRSLKDQVFTDEVEKKTYQEKFTRVLDELRLMRRLAVQHNIEIDPEKVVLAADPPPPVSGVVLDKQKNERGTVEFIQISVGSDDGLRKGHQLYIYRLAKTGGERAQYLGQIRLVDVKPDEAVGTVIEKAKNGVIQKGDYASTKL